MSSDIKRIVCQSRGDTYLEEILDVLQNEYPTVREVWLLRNLRRASRKRFFTKNAIFADLFTILAFKVFSQCCNNLGPTSYPERIEDQNAGPIYKTQHAVDIY
jgi:hypothetical protein